MTTVIGKDVGLYNRTNNTIYYASPIIASLKILASISMLEGDANNVSSEVISFAVIYKTKNIYIGLADEIVNAGQKGNRLTLGYTFVAGNKIGIGYEKGNYASGADHKAYVANGVMKLSSLYILKATYGKRTAAKDETAIGLGFVRDLGAKSALYLILHKNKDDNAAIDNTVIDSKVVSLGMKYTF